MERSWGLVCLKGLGFPSGRLREAIGEGLVVSVPMKTPGLKGSERETKAWNSMLASESPERGHY